MSQHIKKMFQAASSAKEKSYSPYSKFRVGACILGDDGKLYVGCNIENASYRMTQCAESSAVSAMVTAGVRRIKEILVVGDIDEKLVPCGACRQQLREFSDINTLVHLCNKHGETETISLFDLLHRSFGPEFLEEK